MRLLLLLLAGIGACAPAPEMGHLLHDPPALLEGGLVNVLVEIPAGTNEKWQVEKEGGGMEWELENGVPRLVDYLAYPANYGIVPRTLLSTERGGDGDPLDILLLGPAHPRGSFVPARVVGVLRLVDRGEKDDKLLAVPGEGPFSGVRDLTGLEARYPGVLPILETWFGHYKGTGIAVPGGFGDAEEAAAMVREAIRDYERSRTAEELPGGAG